MELQTERVFVLSGATEPIERTEVVQDYIQYMPDKQEIRIRRRKNGPAKAPFNLTRLIPGSTLINQYLGAWRGIYFRLF